MLFYDPINLLTLLTLTAKTAGKYYPSMVQSSRPKASSCNSSIRARTLSSDNVLSLKDRNVPFSESTKRVEICADRDDNDATPISPSSAKDKCFG